MTDQLPPIEELERLGDDASPGPWRLSEDRGMIESDYLGTVVDAEILTTNDAVFIVRARNHWSALLAELRRLREENERLKADAERWRWVKKELSPGNWEWTLRIPARIAGWIFNSREQAVDKLIEMETQTGDGASP